MANDPPFATLNHFAADLGIPSESDLLRIGISSYLQNSQKYRCNTQQTAGVSIFHTSPTGFKGTDGFEIELVGGHGQSRKASFRVSVK
jgi:hypothetical protein